MKTITRSRAALLGGLALLVAAGCSKDSTSPSASVLHGNWVATKWEYTNQANTAQKVDLTSAAYPGGAVTVTLYIDNPATGSYKVVYAQGGATQTITGTYTVSGSNFVITETGASSPESIPFVFSNSNNTLTMTSTSSSWDFGSGDVPATLAMVLNKI
jgi:hypothetical protein